MTFSHSLLTQPPLTGQANLGEISPARRRYRDGADYLGHPVIAHLPTTQHVRYRVTAPPPDGVTIVPVAIEEHQDLTSAGWRTHLPAATGS